MICKICQESFQENHFNEKYCGVLCRRKMFALAQKKYRKTPKGIINVKKCSKKALIEKHMQRWRQTPRGKYLNKLTRKRFYQRHLGYWKKYDRSWEKTEQGREVNRIAKKKYRQTPKGKIAIRNGHVTYRSTLKKMVGKFTLAEWNLLLRKHNYVCANSKCENDSNLEADHIIPISKGGTNLIQNVQPLCRSCNARKSNKIIRY